MDWLNYHHLLYFWTVAREGGLTAAASKLRLSPPTISAQVNALEKSLGEALFERQGRRLVLTEVGHVVFRYAEEIFSLGRELVDTVKNQGAGKSLRLAVGVADAVPKLIALSMLRAALEGEQRVVVVCREDQPNKLVKELATHALDVVIADTPAVNFPGVRVFSHALGQSKVAFFGVERLVAKYKPGFPGSLDGAPVLMPGAGTSLRRSLEDWFDTREIRPETVGEFDDSALMSAFGQEGLGIFAAPVAIEAEVQRQYRARKLGIADGVIESYYAISAERRLKHPAVVALQKKAHQEIFKGSRRTRKK